MESRSYNSAVERATQAASRYINKQVSLLSTSDVRYNGELYTVDPAETSIALKHVDCLGTEDRRAGADAISASDCTYEFIIFRAVNIKSLRLEEADGRGRDLTREILEPLAQAGKETTNKRQSRQSNNAEDSKRRVGYDPQQSRQNYSYGDRYVQQQAAPQHAPQSSYYNYGSSSRSGQYSSQPSTNRHYQQYYDRGSSSGQYGGSYGVPSGSSSGYYGSSSRGHQHQHQQHHHQQHQHQHQHQYSSRGYVQAPPQYTSSRGYAPQPQYSGSRGYPPQQGSRQSSRGYYGQGVAYPPPQSSRDYYSRQRDAYAMYGRQDDRGYYPPRDSRGYQVSPQYIDDRRGYYPPRHYQQGRNYQSYPRQGDRRQYGGNMGRNRDNRQRMPRGGGGNPRMRGPQEAPGTGAFLQSKNQQDDAQDMNQLKADFDFGTTLAQYEKDKSDKPNDDEKNELAVTTEAKKDNNNAAAPATTQADDADVTTGDTEQKADKNTDNTGTTAANDDGLKEDKKDIDAATDQFASMSLDIEPKYDKSKSFFDNLPQETRKDKRNEQRRNESQAERNVDAETFGNIAISYRSRHRYNNRGNQGRNQPRRQRGIDVPRGYDIRGFATRRGNRRQNMPMGHMQRKPRQYDDVSQQQRWRKRDHD